MISEPPIAGASYGIVTNTGRETVMIGDTVTVLTLPNEPVRYKIRAYFVNSITLSSSALRGNAGTGLGGPLKGK